MHLAELVRFLDVAVGPAILVSGVGLLLLSMTNRFGRIIDRARMLIPKIANEGGERAAQITAQIRILAQRARVLRSAITLAVLSLLLAVLLVMGLFAAAASGYQGGAAAVSLATCFVVSLISLIGAISLFLFELNLSLQALWLELPAECRVRRLWKSAA